MAKHMIIPLLLCLTPFSRVMAEVAEFTIFNRMFTPVHKSSDSVYLHFTRDKTACPLGKENRDYRCITKQNISIVSVGEQVKGSMHTGMETIYTLDEVMSNGAVFSYISSPRNTTSRQDKPRSTGKIFVRFK